MRKSIREERIKEIHEAALALFAKKGFVATSLDEIADKVNLSKPALYLYFENKENLFFTIVKSRIENLSKGIKAIVQTDESADIKIKHFIQFYLNFFVVNKDFFRIIHKLRNEIVGDKRKAMKKISKNFKLFISLSASLMQEGIEQKFLKNEDPKFLASALIGILNQSIFTIIAPNLDCNKQDDIQKDGIDNLEQQIFNLFIYGSRRMK